MFRQGAAAAGAVPAVLADRRGGDWGRQWSGVGESPLRDAEVLEMLASTLLDELGVRGWRLELNSIGSDSADRVRYDMARR